MRRYDEQIPVWQGETDDLPARFRWHGAMWTIRRVQHRWVETGAWWRGPLVRSEALLRATEVQRVEAASSRTGLTGVFELAHDRAGDSWTLRRVVD